MFFFFFWQLKSAGTNDKDIYGVRDWGKLSCEACKIDKASFHVFISTIFTLCILRNNSDLITIVLNSVTRIGKHIDIVRIFPESSAFLVHLVKSLKNFLSSIDLIELICICESDDSVIVQVFLKEKTVLSDIIVRISYIAIMYGF